VSTIRTIYYPVNGVRQRPSFPATDQHPLAARHDFDHPALGPLCIDALDGPPTQAEIDARELPSQDTRAALFVDSVDRLQFDVLFAQENNIRELRQAMRTLCAAINQPTPFTAAQAGQIDKPTFRQALINRWKALNP
jgi:hypothetical protein